MTEKKVFTHVSGKALKGFQRLSQGREIVAMPSAGGFTVVAKYARSASAERFIERKKAERAGS